MKTGTSVYFRVALLTILILVLVVSMFRPQSTASAAAILTIRPLTWNIIGLDSNNVGVGPNNFPIGARVCNTGDAVATNVTSNFIWDDGAPTHPYINLRSGSLSSISVPSLAIGACTDFYYEVTVTRDPAAYDKIRRYHITATADTLGVVSTPTPRELYVEHLISQNRNTVSDVKYATTLAGLTSVPNGGTMSLVVGNTYYIQLVGATATQGYEQIESFINFPNTVFQVLSVNTTYSAFPTPHTDPDWASKLYADGCKWENNPNSPNYRSCTATGKYGGNVTVTYQVRILSVGSTNPQPLSTLLYDFSGSSYHYNSDFGVSTRYAYILDPSEVTISKSFSPDPTTVNGVSTLTFTITNPTPSSFSGLNFSDTLPTTPGAMVVANTPGASTTGCGSPTFAPTAGAGSLSLSNGSVAANSTCTIKVSVTVPATGTYTNTSGHLFIGTLDTGNFATDTLTVNSAPPGPSPACGLTMAQWTFASFTTNPPPFPAANTQAPDVTTAAISNGNGLTSEADTTASGGNPQPGIRNYGWQKTGPVVTGTSASLQFAIDTSKYTQVTLQFDAQRKANGPTTNEIYYSTNGTTWALKSSFNTTTSWASYGAYDFTGQTSTTGVTYFRIYGYGANATSSGNDINFDNVSFVGCGTPTPPTLSKSFSQNPVAVGATSALVFTLTNPNTGVDFTGLSFTDTLPIGLTVPTGSSSQCGGTLTTTAPRTISFSGGTRAAGLSCTVTVTVTTTASGIYDNVSGFVSSTEGGTNTGSTGIATASLTVLTPPSISKLFDPNPIISGGMSTLTFTITNPNLNDALTGVAFSDTYPPGLQNTTTPNGATTCMGGSVTTPISGTTVSLNGATLAAGGTCTVTVNVTASTGTFPNTSSAVTSTNAGTGNTASDTLTVNAPNPGLGLLKQISTSASGPWTSFVAVTAGSNVYYRFTVENLGDVTLTSINFSDDSLPPALLASCNPTWATPLPVAVADNENHIAKCVVGPVAAVAGSHLNTARASGNYSTGTTPEDTSSAAYATIGLTLTKTVTEAFFVSVNDILHYSFVVTNSGFAPLLGPVIIADDQATDETCPAVNTVGDLDDYLDRGETVTCSATHTITNADVTAGLVTNTAFATAGGVTSNTATVTVQTPTPTLTNTPTNTPTSTPTNTPTNTATNTPTDTPINTPTNSATATPTDTPTNTATSTPTDTPTNTPTITPTTTATDTPTNTPTSTPTDTSTNTPTSTPTNSETHTATNTATATLTSISTSTATDTPTATSTGTPSLLDPPLGLKTFDDAGLPLLHWSMIWINNANTVAINSFVSDGIPVGTTYVASGLSSGFPVPSGAPPGSTDTGVSCTDSSAITLTTLCYYEGPTVAFPRGRIIWAGTLGPDNGATLPANANHEITITFNVNVAEGTNSVRNTATIDSDLNGDGDPVDPGEIQVATTTISWRRSVSKRLPSTGFAPNVITNMNNFPRETYLETGGITIEIPSLKINIPIVGVPLRDGEWNVTWLGRQAGWLQGSAFPSWNGNSVITSHVYLANGLPGPFVNLINLHFGEKVIIHAYGEKYVFEVRSNEIVEPNDASVFKHEERAWLTLVTCRDYDEKINAYRKRVVVRAVLVNVTAE